MYVHPIILYFATQYTSTVSVNPTSKADSETEADSGDDSLLLGENVVPIGLVEWTYNSHVSSP